MPAQSTVPILHKAIRVIRALSGPVEIGSIQQLAEVAGVATTSCFRIANTLERERWVTKPGPGDPYYRLSVGLLPLLEPLQNVQRLVALSQSSLTALAQATSLSAKLSVREGLEAVTIARVEPNTGMSIGSPVGSRFPIVVGSSGAALLAALADAEIQRIVKASPPQAWAHQQPSELLVRVAACRSAGVCVDVGSYHPSLAGWSATITSRGLHAAVTVTGLTQDLLARGESQIVPALRQAAKQLLKADASPV